MYCEEQGEREPARSHWLGAQLGGGDRLGRSCCTGGQRERILEIFCNQNLSSAFSQ